MDNAKRPPKANIDQPFFKETLAPGCWVMFRKLPPMITDQQMSEYLLAFGIDVPADRISIIHYHNGSSAKVSMPDDTITRMVNQTTGSAPFFEGGDAGYRVTAHVWSK